jgi:murein DD-endopeptidase MepM/ murein hydrolase activator NlpD
MSKTKLYISATLFLLLTMLKFAFPSLAVDIRDAVIPALTKDADYKSAMSDIGKSLSASDGILDTLEGMIRQDGDTLEAGENLISSPVRDNYMPMTIGELHSDFTAPARQAGDTQSADGEEAEVSEDAPETTSVPESAPPETQAPEATQAPEPTQAAEADNGVPDVVEAFLASQAKFEGYALPTNVSADMPALPFEYASPVSGMLSSGFGYRLHPIDNEIKFHYGTDIAAVVGTDIMSFADGTVANAGENDGYGKYLIISHDGGYVTLYAHCSNITAYIGQSVTKGQVIAEVGETGDVTGPHLHFELMHDYIYMNPEYYINTL